DTPSFHPTGSATSGEISVDWRPHRHRGSELARFGASQTSLAESPHCHFAFVAELFMCGPPVGGTFWFQIFIQAPSPEIWSETISGGEEVLAGKGVACFWATSLEKIIGGVMRSSRPAQEDGCSSLPCRGVLSFRSEAREGIGARPIMSTAS